MVLEKQLIQLTALELVLSFVYKKYSFVSYMQANKYGLWGTKM